MLLSLDDPAIPTETGARTSPLLDTPSDERNASFAPDGRWISYELNKSGQFQVYVKPFPNVNDAEHQISTEGGLSARLVAQRARAVLRQQVCLDGGGRAVDARVQVGQFDNPVRGGVIDPGWAAARQYRTDLRHLSRRSAFPHDEGHLRCQSDCEACHHCCAELVPGTARPSAPGEVIERP